MEALTRVAASPPPPVDFVAQRLRDECADQAKIKALTKAKVVVIEFPGWD